MEKRRVYHNSLALYMRKTNPGFRYANQSCPLPSDARTCPCAFLSPHVYVLFSRALELYIHSTAGGSGSRESARQGLIMTGFRSPPLSLYTLGNRKRNCASFPRIKADALCINNFPGSFLIHCCYYRVNYSVEIGVQCRSLDPF